MALTITDDRITSDLIEDTAEYRRNVTADGGNAWICQGPLTIELSAHLLNYDAAITAMTMAEVYAQQPPKDNKIWLHVAGWRKELGLDPDPSIPFEVR